MEEFVGKHWHRFITRRARSSYPEAAVQLSAISKPLAILFRAFGGDGGLKIEVAAPQDHGARRNWLQCLAGSNQRAALAWRDDETLRLPERLDIYPSQSLNRDLYFWLAALAAVAEQGSGDWFSDNQRCTVTVLARFPGLRSRYQRLVAAELARRPNLHDLPADEAAQERAVQVALQHPGTVSAPASAKRPPQPVWLWLYPAYEAIVETVAAESVADDEHEPEGESEAVEQHHRYRAKESEMPDGKDGLITMRWENILSWAEYIKVNRATDDDKDDGAADTAADMDVLTVARDQQSSATRLRLDLDLPSAQYDDLPLQGITTLPEWDWRKQKLLPDHCEIHPMLPRGSEPLPLPTHLQRTAQRLRGQFAALAQQRVWHRGQQDGSELDMAAYLDYHITRTTQSKAEAPGLYRDLRQSQRDLATLLLADLSLSTDAAINNDQRVIDVIRASLLLFAEALSACNDRYALYGFSSRNRQQVRFFHLKQFEDRYSDVIRGHIQAIRPGYYTRMGAAIRHSTNIFIKQKASKRLLLILTDGKPNDLDRYEGRYGVEDTRMAIHEARQQGLIPFCITIDREADDYLPYLFGQNGYVLLRRPEELPKRLLGLYARLTGS